MKNLIYILLLFCYPAFLAGQSFEEGNELYRKGNYSEAAKVYENILKTGTHSAELYFNLGNAYYKQAKVAPSIYNYERALLLNPNDDEIKSNLEFARKLRIDEVKEVPRVGFDKLLRDFTSTMSFDSWAYLAIVCSFLCVLAFAGYYFASRALHKRLFFIAMFITLIGILLAIFAASFEKNAQVNERAAIVFSEIVSVKGEPVESAQEAFTLHEGTKVYVLEDLDNWRKIELPDGSKGWINRSAIREIRP